MFRFTLVVALFATALGFAPAGRSTASRSMSLSMGAKSKSVPFLPVPEKCVGLPGSKEFDPIGFSDSIDIRWMQEAEIKHSRVAMLAFLGYVFADFHHPVLGVSSVEGHNAAVASGAGWQVLAFIAGLEFISCVAVKEMFDGSGRKPGEFGFDPAGMHYDLHCVLLALIFVRICLYPVLVSDPL